MPIRVIRTLEYTYANQEECDKDMARWFVPPMGLSADLGHHRTSIRSSVMFPEPINMPESSPTQKD
jgi:hypothetical protein